MPDLRPAQREAVLSAEACRAAHVRLNGALYAWGASGLFTMGLFVLATATPSKSCFIAFLVSAPITIWLHRRFNKAELEWVKLMMASVRDAATLSERRLWSEWVRRLVREEAESRPSP